MGFPGTTTCPVCGHVIFLKGYLCGECGYEIHILPECVSPSVLKYEEERLSNARNIWKERLEKEKNSAQLAYAYLIQYNESEAQNVYPLSLGVNIFGTHKGDKTHHQVSLGDLDLEHFSVEVTIVDNNGKSKPSFSIVPMDGSITIDNPSAAPISSGIHKLSKNQDVYAGGLHFRLLGNKALK